MVNEATRCGHSPCLTYLLIHVRAISITRRCILCQPFYLLLGLLSEFTSFIIVRGEFFPTQIPSAPVVTASEFEHIKRRILPPLIWRSWKLVLTRDTVTAINPSDKSIGQ